MSDTVELTLVIPVYNEVDAISETITTLVELMSSSSLKWEALFVDDGSTDGTGEKLDSEIHDSRVRIIRHQLNKGYGAALKTGIRAARGERVAITDADLTYPLERLQDLYDISLKGVPMVVGSRTGADVNIPLLRRFPKWVLRRLASYLAGTHIPDLNSGFRVFIRKKLLPHLALMPNGFSFTTTITLVMLTRGEDVIYEPIDYHGRVGSSKIRPIRDTLLFLQLIIRTVTLFQPLKIYLPTSILLEFLAIFIVVYCKFHPDNLPVPDSTVAIIAMSGVMMFGIGLLADLFSRRILHLHEMLIHHDGSDDS